MRPSFLPRLVNSGFEDPVLFVPFVFLGKALLFDLGDINALTPREALKISHVFVSHTHMDHFCGFDRLLRLFLGRDKTLHLYGPPGFIANVRGKLAGYTWNLVQNNDSRFSLEVTEVHADHLRSQQLTSRLRFEPGQAVQKKAWRGVICREKEFFVAAALLDHGTPCLAFALEEPFHVNIIAEAVTDLGLTVGPWVGDFKRALFSNRDWEQVFTVAPGDVSGAVRSFRLAGLAERIARITAGQKVAYIVDAAFSPRNELRMIDLCRGANHVFIEAAFLHCDRDIAARKHHLTARQAGTIAARSGAQKLTICHLSPRYEGRADRLEAEAAAAFDAARPES
jgi:ribonuclease Z